MRDPSSGVESGRSVVVFSIVWFFCGCLGFFCFALLAFLLNPFAQSNVFEPEGYRSAVFVWQFPMIWGWVPAAYRSARRRGAPWRNAKRTIVFGAIVGPLLFLGAMLVTRLVLQD